MKLNTGGVQAEKISLRVGSGSLTGVGHRFGEGSAVSRFVLAVGVWKRHRLLTANVSNEASLQIESETGMGETQPASSALG